MIFIKEETKELLIKGFIVLSTILGILFVPVIPIFMGIYGYSESSLIYKLWIFDFILLIVAVITMIIFMKLFKFRSKSQNYEKILIPFDDYNKFINLFGISIYQQNYKRQGVIYKDSEIEVLLFTKQKFWLIECISIVKAQKITNATINLLNEKFNEFLRKYYNKEKITDSVSMITLVCVDQFTPKFQKFINSNAIQGFKNYRLPVGVSFSKKSIYIAKPTNDFAIVQYKRLKRKFMKLLIEINKNYNKNIFKEKKDE